MEVRSEPTELVVDTAGLPGMYGVFRDHGAAATYSCVYSIPVSSRGITLQRGSGSAVDVIGVR